MAYMVNVPPFQTKDPMDMAYLVRLRNSFTNNYLNVVRFNALKMDSEKVNYVLDVVKNSESEYYRKIVFNPKVFKCNKEAEHLRKEGNVLFLDKKYQEALVHYTKSLAFASNNSSYMALAYGNRAILLFHKRYYKECIKDIHGALSCDCPLALKTILSAKLCYCNMCVKLQKYQKTAKFCLYFPIILNEHSTVSAASDAVDIEKISSFGRSIVAAKDIKVGEVISIEKPYATQIAKPGKYFHCDECLAVCFNLIPCKFCTTALYCSEICMNRAFKKHHKYGCEIPIIEEIDFFFLKIFLNIQTEENSFYFDNEYRSDRGEEILNLFADESRLGLTRISLAMVAGLAFSVLKFRTVFFAQNKISEESTKALLYKLAMKALLNQITNYKRTNVVASEELAKGIFSFSSLYNHSCAPNCIVTFHRDIMVVRTVENIKAGEHCTISYLVNYDEAFIDDRLVTLLTKFHFRCNCIACKNDWPKMQISQGGKPAYWDFLPRKIAHKIAYDVYLNKKQTEDQRLEEVANDFEPLLRICSSRPPVDTYLLLVNTLRKIFFHSGNKIFQF